MLIKVKKDSIHVEALRKEWLGVERLAKAEPRYHFNPFKKLFIHIIRLDFSKDIILLLML